MFNFNHRYTPYILIFLVIIASGLRFYGMAYTSLNFEEQMLWFIGSKHSLIDTIAEMWNYKPTSLILGITTWLTNYDLIQYEFVSRLISYISGIAAIPFIFYLARKFYGEIEGLISAAFVTFSWQCIDISALANQYSLLLLLLLAYFLSLLSFLDAIAEEKDPSIKLTAAFISTGLLLGITSVWGIVAVAISFFYIFFFVTKIRYLLTLLSKFAFILLPTALLAWIFFQYQVILEPHSISILTSLSALNEVIADNYLLSCIVVAPLIWLAIVHIQQLITNNENTKEIRTIFSNSTLVLTIWLVGSIGAALLLPYFLHIKYEISDFIICLPPLIILMARSIILLSNDINRQFIIGGTFTAIIILSSYLNLEKLTDYTEYNQATRFLLHHNYANELLFAGNDFPKQAFSYYLRKNHLPLKYSSFDGKLSNLQISYNTIQSKNTKQFWYLIDNTIVEENYVPSIIDKFDVIDGYRFRNLSLLLINIR